MKHIEEILPDFLNGTLDGETSKAVENHLLSCAKCRQESDALRSLFTQLEAGKHPIVPSGYFSTIVPRVRERIEKPTLFRISLYSSILQRMAPVVAAAALVILLINLDYPKGTFETVDNGLAAAMQDMTMSDLTEAALDQFSFQPLDATTSTHEALSEIGSKALSIDLLEEQVPAMSGLLSNTLNNGTSIQLESISESELNTLLERLGERIIP
ncbi:MAG: zf-HC2 domain-containing protein [bacterium]